MEISWDSGGPNEEKCHRLYSAAGRWDDLALFYHAGKFFALEAWCTHMGGPLFNGDIEDYKGKCHVMCPWHGYMFDLENGENEIGLRQEVHEVKAENGKVHVLHRHEMTLTPPTSSQT